MQKKMRTVKLRRFQRFQQVQVTKKTELSVAFSKQPAKANPSKQSLQWHQIRTLYPKIPPWPQIVETDNSWEAVNLITPS